MKPTAPDPSSPRELPSTAQREAQGHRHVEKLRPQLPRPMAGETHIKNYIPKSKGFIPGTHTTLCNRHPSSGQLCQAESDHAARLSRL